MWPFRRRPPPPAPVVVDGVTASFGRHWSTVWWEWTLEDMTFHLYADPLPSDWLDRSRDALATARTLMPQIGPIVAEHVRDWGDPSLAVFSIDLRPEAGPDGFTVIADAEPWGDLGVHIEVAAGIITAHWSGD